MRNREELNFYIQKKAKDKILLAKRKKNNIYKLICVCFLVCVSLLFAGRYLDIYQRIVNESSFSSNTNEELEYSDCSNQFSSFLPGLGEESFGSLEIVSCDEYLILKSLYTAVNLYDEVNGTDPFKYDSLSSSNATIESIKDNLIIVRYGSNSSVIEEILSIEKKKVLYNAFENIVLKPISNIDLNDMSEVEVLQEKFEIQITFMGKNYFIIIKGGQIRINNNWYTFNREVLDVFLEVIKNSVVE